VSIAGALSGGDGGHVANLLESAAAYHARQAASVGRTINRKVVPGTKS
jgi:hypothetical protein